MNRPLIVIMLQSGKLITRGPVVLLARRLQAIVRIGYDGEMHEETLQMIDAYLIAGREAIGEFFAAYPNLTNILQWRSRGISREGILPSGRTYSFHGIGCRFDKDGKEVDIDFGPNGVTNGFDAWRILQCWKSSGHHTSQSLEAIQIDLDELLAKGKVSKQKDRSLYFLSPARDSQD
jgi:hypothetical protein